MRPGLGRGQGGAGGLALRGVAEVAEDALHRLGTRTARARCGSARGSGSISLRALMAIGQAIGCVAQAAGELLGGLGGGDRMVGLGARFAQVLGHLVE